VGWGGVGWSGRSVRIIACAQARVLLFGSAFGVGVGGHWRGRHHEHTRAPIAYRQTHSTQNKNAATARLQGNQVASGRGCCSVHPRWCRSTAPHAPRPTPEITACMSRNLALVPRQPRMKTHHLVGFFFLTSGKSAAPGMLSAPAPGTRARHLAGYDTPKNTARRSR
jgi:hypothetical protein